MACTALFLNMTILSTSPLGSHMVCITSCNQHYKNWKAASVNLDLTTNMLTKHISEKRVLH